MKTRHRQRNRWSALAGMLLCALMIPAANAMPEEFLYGNYTVIGRHTLTGEAYTSSARLFMEAGSFIYERTLGTTTVRGTAGIETITHDDIRVLRLRYRDNGAAIVATCLVSADLDNYARLTCQTGRPEKHKGQPGFEAYFIAH